jgi:hypothetical protein
MLSFEKVIRRYGKEAVRLQVEESKKDDDPALEALSNRRLPERAEAIQTWLNAYNVFQGIEGSKRVAVAAEILKWADSPNRAKSLTTLDLIVKGHSELAKICSRAEGRERKFVSLASKVLWLRYPDTVPMFDSFAQRALWAINKFDPNGLQTFTQRDEYGQFVEVWQSLYVQHSIELAKLNTRGYPYQVRIFDKILWLVGQRSYTIE